MADQPAATFGALLRAYRLQAGLSQGELAERASLSLNAVGALERGRHRRPYPRTVALLADALDLNPDQRSRLAAAAYERPGDALTPSQASTSEAGAPRPDRCVPASLPAATTSFVGREREVMVLRAWLGRPEVRLLTLTGPPGVGKTRLALEVARGLQDKFPDGVCFVPLAAVRDPALLIPTLARALAVEESGARSRAEDLAAFLRERTCLLVCDNFEQIVAAAPDLDDLLAACPWLKVLVTSRAALRLYGEHEVVVDPLDLPASNRSLPVERLGEMPSVRLFVERARAVQSDFVLTPDNAATVADICRRLDGLPLAIELAAARIRIFSPSALLARLEGRFLALESRAPNLPERQRALDAAIAWSYDLLSPNERLLFERVSVFAGSFDLRAAEAVCRAGLDPATKLVDGIEALVSQSLLRARPSGREPRFIMLETIREFGLDRLDRSGARDELERAHAEFYCRLAVEAAGPDFPTWSGGAPPRTGHLARDVGNFRAALRWLIANRCSADAVQMAHALSPFWVEQLSGAEGLRWLQDALRLSPAGAPDRLRARALETAAFLAHHGDLDVAIAYADESLAIYQSLGDRPGSLRLLTIRAFLANQAGDYGAARTKLDEAVGIARGLDNPMPLAVTLTVAADSAIDRGDLALGRALVEQALSLARATGQESYVVQNLWNQGRLALIAGDASQAEARYREALAIAHRVQLEGWAAVARYGLAYLACQRGEYDLARQEIEAGIQASRRIEWLLGVMYGLDTRAVLAAARGDRRLAARLAGAGTTLREASHSVRHPIWQTLLRRVAVPLDRPSDPALAAAWDAGRTMTFEQAIAGALRELTAVEDQPVDTHAADPIPPAPAAEGSPDHIPSR